MGSDRTRREATRLKSVARAAGLDDVELWWDAQAEARDADRVDVTPLTVMRRLLDERGVDHRAPDPFGARAPETRSA